MQFATLTTHTRGQGGRRRGRKVIARAEHACVSLSLSVLLRAYLSMSALRRRRQSRGNFFFLSIVTQKYAPIIIVCSSLRISAALAK